MKPRFVKRFFVEVRRSRNKAKHEFKTKSEALAFVGAQLSSAGVTSVMLMQAPRFISDTCPDTLGDK